MIARRGSRPRDRHGAPRRRARAGAHRRGRGVRVRARHRPPRRGQRRGLHRRGPRSTGIAAYVESTSPEVAAGRDRVRPAALPRRDVRSTRRSAARDRARAAGADRARQGHPDGAPGDRRARGVRDGCATRRAPPTGAWSTRASVVEGHPLLPAARRPGVARARRRDATRTWNEQIRIGVLSVAAREPAPAPRSSPATSSARSSASRRTASPTGGRR